MDGWQFLLAADPVERVVFMSVLRATEIHRQKQRKELSVMIANNIGRMF